MMCWVAKGAQETGCLTCTYKLQRSLLTLSFGVLLAKSNVALLSCCKLPEGVMHTPGTVCMTCSCLLPLVQIPRGGLLQ